MTQLRRILVRSGTLAPVSAYGLADDAVRVAAGGAIGRYLDGAASRVAAATRLYALQHACVAASALLALIAAAAAPHSAGRALLAVLLVASGAAAGVGAAGSSLAVERQFTKSLCGADVAALARLNARMRAVDLACLLLAPIFAGALLQGAGLAAAVLALSAYNAAAFWPERALLRAAALAAPNIEARDPAANAATEEGPGWRQALALYRKQSVLPAALSLALLYFTVLSLGFLMTAYLHARGVPDVAIAIVRAAGAATGLAATASFPRLATRVPLPMLAACGVAMQLFWLLIGVIPQLTDVASSAPLLRLLMASLALSRFGLWTADLAVSQMLQDDVAEAELGAVNGVQGSVCAAFEMASFVAGLALRTPRDYVALMAASCAAVALAAAVLTRFALVRRAGATPLPRVPAELEAGAPLAVEHAPLLSAPDDR